MTDEEMKAHIDKLRESEPKRSEGSLERVVKRRRIRATLTNATGLDETLCRIQDAGGTVCNIMAYCNSAQAQQHDKGDGKHDLAMSMGTGFVVTYSEAS